MVWIASVFLLLIWALAVVSERMFGGAAHLLLLAAVILMSARVFRLRRTPVK